MYFSSPHAEPPPPGAGAEDAAADDAAAELSVAEGAEGAEGADVVAAPVVPELVLPAADESCEELQSARPRTKAGTTSKTANAVAERDMMRTPFEVGYLASTTVADRGFRSIAVPLRRARPAVIRPAHRHSGHAAAPGGVRSSSRKHLSVSTAQSRPYSDIRSRVKPCSLISPCPR